jgi:cytidylate kinase
MAFNVCIDSPVAAGGTSLAGHISERLEMPKIPTSGALRALSVVLEREGRNPLDISDDEVIAIMRANIGRIGLTIAGGEVDGINIAVEGAQEKHGAGASRVAALQIVRNELLNPLVLQCAMTSPVNTVSEGRNEFRLFNGDVIPLEQSLVLTGIYLAATVEARVHRFRGAAAKRLGKNPDTVTYQEVVQAILERDLQDMTRDVEPLQLTEGAQDIRNHSPESARKRSLGYDIGAYARMRAIEGPVQWFFDTSAYDEEQVATIGCRIVNAAIKAKADGHNPYALHYS